VSQNNGIQLTNVALEQGEGGLVSLTIEVAPETVQSTRDRVIKQFAKRIRVPGFRPGHAPANVVRRNVGDEAIAQEVSDQLVPAAYQAAIEQEKVQPLERAEVDQLTFDAFDGDKPLTFVARVIARPEITLGTVEGLTATKRTINITDADVDSALERMREERAYLVNAPERGAENGDVLFAEVQVYIDGEPRSEEPAKLRGFVLGQSGFVPAIDEHLVGQNLDETRKFTVTYPEDFQDAELANKEAEFEVKITAIKTRVVPELTDEFAQIAGAADLADLRTQLQQYLETSGERDARREVREQLVEAAANNATLEIPTALVDVRLQERLRNIEQELAQNGATIEAYLASIGSTQEQMEEDLRTEISSELKAELVLDELATREELPVTMPEVEQHYVLMAQMMERPIEEVVKNIPVANVRTSILQRKAIDWLAERAVITDENGNTIELNVPAMEDETDEIVEEAVAEAVLAAGEEEAETVEAGTTATA
jgi:trigger factor